jgi:hypothetical protein
VAGVSKRAPLNPRQYLSDDASGTFLISKSDPMGVFAGCEIAVSESPDRFKA